MTDGPNIVTNGLVFYVDASDTTSFRRGNDTTWRDLTTNGVNGTITGATFSTEVRGCFSFNSLTQNYINFGTGLDQVGSFTISCWAKRNGTQGGTYGVICGRSGASPTFSRNYLLTFGSPTANMKFTQSSDNNKTVTSTTVAANNTWYDIAGVYDTTTNKMSIYIDGILENFTYISLTTDPPTGGSQYFQIGTSDGLNRTNWLDGSVSCVKLYNRNLSDEEIYFNYRVQKTRFRK